MTDYRSTYNGRPVYEIRISFTVDEFGRFVQVSPPTGDTGTWVRAMILGGAVAAKEAR